MPSEDKSNYDEQPSRVSSLGKEVATDEVQAVSHDSTSLDQKIPTLKHLDVVEDIEGSATGNPFLDPQVAAHYREVYENSHYESRHVFDPALTWSREEERAIVRKLDWRVCLWAVC